MLQTTTFVQIVEFKYIDVYVGNNLTGKTVARDLQRYDAIAGFDVVEWICKISTPNEQRSPPANRTVLSHRHVFHFRIIIALTLSYLY